jgi:hypothetical protein
LTLAALSLINNSRIPIASVQPPIVAGVALDGKEWRVVQLFDSVIIGLSLELLPPQLETRQSTIFNQLEARNTKRESAKRDSDWPESEEDQLESRQRRLTSGNTCLYPVRM